VTETDVKVDPRDELVDKTLDIAEMLLKVHAHVQMDTAEDKALHAKGCDTFATCLAELRCRARELRHADDSATCS